MKIAVYGKGNVGGGLADLWEKKGHQVTRLGREGGDVSQAEVILIAVPGDKLADALDKLKGIAGKTVIDATNLINAKPPAGFRSNAEFVKSKTNGPTAKAFNINFASLYGRLGGTRTKPGNLWCGDEQTRKAVEQLSRDAGYDPVSMGGLTNAALQESLIGPVFAIAQAGTGPFVYRIATPENL
jgi:8-hydroxy-5-deazaflavin:NADPH oxidoreductase